MSSKRSPAADIVSGRVRLKKYIPIYITDKKQGKTIRVDSNLFDGIDWLMVVLTGILAIWLPFFWYIENPLMLDTTSLHVGLAGMSLVWMIVTLWTHGIKSKLKQKSFTVEDFKNKKLTYSFYITWKSRSQTENVNVESDLGVWSFEPSDFDKLREFLKDKTEFIKQQDEII